MPIAAFGMMLVSEIAALIFAHRLPRETFAYMRYPVISVRACLPLLHSLCYLLHVL